MVRTYQYKWLCMLFIVFYVNLEKDIHVYLYFIVRWLKKKGIRERKLIYGGLFFELTMIYFFLFEKNTTALLLLF